MELSVVLTCLNQEKVLQGGVETIQDILNKNKIKYEIIIVDDGSTDSTYSIMKKLSKKYKHIRLFKHPYNIGRGRAVSNGFKIAKGEFVGFLDTDLELHPRYIPIFLEELKKGYDVVTYLRKYKLNSTGVIRGFTTHAYNLLLRLLLNVRLNDTESGFKFFRREKIIPVLNEINEDRWFWDTEIMVRSYLNGLKIKEIPLIYTPNKEGGSTVKIFNDSIYFLKKLIKFRKTVIKLRNKINLS
ncbi:MAG: glycosyltransferase family 2 protein [Nanoarchaeota archaeon]